MEHTETTQPDNTRDQAIIQKLVLAKAQLDYDKISLEVDYQTLLQELAQVKAELEQLRETIVPSE